MNNKLPCLLFYVAESRMTELGVEYQGSVSVSETGSVCLPWSSVGAVGPVPRGGELIGNHNYCRNLLLLPEGPGCFTDTRGTYQRCNIPYEGRCSV